jgi:hypothetical protein
MPVFGAAFAITAPAQALNQRFIETGWTIRDAP